MGAVIIVIVFFVFFVAAASESGSTETNSSSSTTYSNFPTTRMPSSSSSSSLASSRKSSSSISVAPKSIVSTPSLRMSLVDGQYRTFENHYVNGKQYTFGFPKSGCKDSRVWVGINKTEVERISISEAKYRISSRSSVGYTTKSIGSGYTNRRSAKAITQHSFGYCTTCSKKLRGDTSKKYCYACWSSNKPSGYGFCSNCNKKLRGNLGKKHCYECWSSGYR